jgi:GT2 family glycosyltransferase/glycosyltransferase involved in cell wall biosynthesis
VVIDTKKLIVVIGMHRTGTSLITRGLQVMGVNLGNNLLPAMADVNAKGFWEDADINALNIEMLHAINSEWDCLTPITATNIQQLEHQGYFLRAVELLRNKVAQVSIFGLKDPRIAKLLPFWGMVFDHCNYDVSYLLTIRHPLSVVKSLQKRDNLSAEKSYLLWFTHVITALTFSIGKNVSLVDYDFFMQHPSDELERLAKDFKLSVINQELQVFLDQFVDNSLRHTHYALDDLRLDSACPYPIQDVYSYLLKIASGETAYDFLALSNLVKQWEKYLDFGQAPFAIIDSLYNATRSAAEEVQEQAQTLELKNHLIGNLEKFNEDRARQIEKLYAATLERDAHAEKLTQQLVAAECERNMLFDAAEQRDNHIVNLNQHIADLNQQLVAAIVDRDERIIELGQQLLLAEKEIQRMFSATLERDEHIANLSQELQWSKGEINRLFLATQERDQHIEQLNNQVQQLFLQNQTILQSRSWRMTRPLRFALRFIKHGLTVEDKSKLLLGLRKLNYKLPSSLQNVSRALFGKWIRSIVNKPVVLFTADTEAPLPQQLQISKSPIMPAVSSGKDFIVWGVIDWHFRHQRPQQIAQALAAEGDRVFYVSSNLLEARSAGFSIEPLDQDGRLFQIHLCVNTPTIIYHHAPSADVAQQLLGSVGEFLLWAKTGQVINIVQHPFWLPVARKLPNSQLIYDCMDHHEGFENTGKEVIALEHELFRVADLTITTSGFLDDIVAKYTPRREIIRNAGEFEYFAKAPLNIYRDPQGRKIIGYYGAIAEWFDIELIRQISQQFPDCLLLLVGADTVSAESQLSSHKNIIFTGEVPYKELTHYLYAFDVCLLPFKVIPLILATNPVKVYEYLGAGKPVVAVDVPEIKQFGDLVRVGIDHEHFVEQVGNVLAEPVTDANVSARKQFAEQQTWHHRARDLARAVSTLQQPKVSVIVVTYNNLELTKACLHSLEVYSNYPNYEVIVVDNASSDDSPNYLREWVAQGDNRTIILNPDNKGFAAGNNQGLLAATGEYLVLLNNDTYVTPGWISSLVKHIERDPKIGLLGPVTCNIGNEAKINIHYANMNEMLVESSKFTLRHIGHLTPLRTAAFFCVMISRAAYEKVGLLDEAFGIGFFEDDDYCRRVEQAGFSIYCADDVFIHHHLSASFNKLKLETRQKLFEDNKVTYEKKWGPWIPHVYRPGVS